MTDKTSCYTYFSITGDFEPDDITRYLNLQPFEQWRIGDEQKNGRKFDCAAWKFGLCEEYDVFVENQMHSTLKELIPKKEKLKRLKADFDLSFSLEIVPSIYIDEIHPCISPSKEVINFCSETGTAIDIDYYVFDSSDEE